MALLKVNHRVARGQLAKVLLSATNLRVSLLLISGTQTLNT